MMVYNDRAFAPPLLHGQKVFNRQAPSERAEAWSEHGGMAPWQRQKLPGRA